MSGVERIRDFFIWLAEIGAALSPARPPARALGVAGGQAHLLRLTGAGYAAERPAAKGDSAPLFLTADQAIALKLEIPAELAVHGDGPARLEAARRSPLPLTEAEWALARAPKAWGAQAEWRFATAPARRLEIIRKTLRGVGAEATGVFVLIDGAPLMLKPGGPPAPRAPMIAGLAALLIIGGAAISAPLGAAQIEAAAEARLAAARAELDEAERDATAGEAQREAAAAPIRAALAGRAFLAAHPPAAAALARLAEGTPDDAYAARIAIAPGRVEGEFIAPDAAALAASLAQNPAFRSARLDGAARAEENGLQRAGITLSLSGDDE